MRDLAAQALDLGLDPLRHRDRVRPRLPPLDREHHRALPVEPAGPLGVLHAVHHAAQVSEMDGCAVAEATTSAPKSAAFSS